MIRDNMYMRGGIALHVQVPPQTSSCLLQDATAEVRVHVANRLAPKRGNRQTAATAYPNSGPIGSQTRPCSFSCVCNDLVCVHLVWSYFYIDLGIISVEARTAGPIPEDIQFPRVVFVGVHMIG